jgi:polysaccharide export outer membrane protein
MKRRRAGYPFVLAGLSAFLLAGCQGLPKSGPDDGAITAGAVVHEKSDPDKPLTDYVVLDINERILSYFTAPEIPGFGATFGVRGRPAGQTLGVGDVVQVTLFESAPGGLFIPADAGSRPGNFIALPQQTVDTGGLITVPYAGRIPVGGRTPAQVEETIRQKLAERAIEPQAILTIVQSRSNEVSVLGDVKAPNKFTINLGGERVLDVISRAGGISAPARETYVTLQRGGRTSTVYFEQLLTNSADNIFIAPGDTVFVNRDRRTFVAIGASGLNGRFDFDNSNIKLAEALGVAGGLLDNRAEPANVFLYRLIPPRIAEKLGLPHDVRHVHGYPIVFRLNMRNPGSLFLAQRFAMQDGDVLYIDNAESVEILKVLGLINAATTTAVGTAADIRTLTR